MDTIRQEYITEGGGKSFEIARHKVEGARKTIGYKSGGKSWFWLRL